MESPSPPLCFADPNFAVIAGFVDKFGKVCGVPIPTVADLVCMLECKDAVPQDLIVLHAALLRRVRRSVHIEKWEKAAVKYCQQYSLQDAAIMEQHGYLNCGLDIKLRFLKNLLESQFDHNTKLKTAVNLLTAEELRPKPVGRDKLGRVYWVQLDPSAQLRVYREEPDANEKSWTLIAQDRAGLVTLLRELSGDDSLDFSVAVDAPELKDTPVLDTGQETDDEDEEGAVELSDGAAEIDDDDEEAALNTKMLTSNNEEKSAADIDGNGCSEAIEESVMHIVGEGNGADCDTGRPSFFKETSAGEGVNFISVDFMDVKDFCSDVIEEPVFYVYGLGSGADCNVGNPEKETSCSANSDKTISNTTRQADMPKPALDLNTLVTDCEKSSLSGAGSPIITEMAASSFKVKESTIQRDDGLEISEESKLQPRVWSINDICGPSTEGSPKPSVSLGKSFTIDCVLEKEKDEVGNSVEESKAPNRTANSEKPGPCDTSEASVEKPIITIEEAEEIILDKQPLKVAINNDLNPVSCSTAITPQDTNPNTPVIVSDIVLSVDERSIENEISSTEKNDKFSETSNVADFGGPGEAETSSAAKDCTVEQTRICRATLTVPEIIITPNTPTNSDTTPFTDSSVGKCDSIETEEAQHLNFEPADGRENVLGLETDAKEESATNSTGACLPVKSGLNVGLELDKKSEEKLSEMNSSLASITGESQLEQNLVNDHHQEGMVSSSASVDSSSQEMSETSNFTDSSKEAVHCTLEDNKTGGIICQDSDQPLTNPTNVGDFTSDGSEKKTNKHFEKSVGEALVNKDTNISNNELEEENILMETASVVKLQKELMEGRDGSIVCSKEAAESASKEPLVVAGSNIDIEFLTVQSSAACEVTAKTKEETKLLVAVDQSERLSFKSHADTPDVKDSKIKEASGEQRTVSKLIHKTGNEQKEAKGSGKMGGEKGAGLPVGHALSSLKTNFISTGFDSSSDVAEGNSTKTSVISTSDSPSLSIQSKSPINAVADSTTEENVVTEKIPVTIDLKTGATDVPNPVNSEKEKKGSEVSEAVSIMCLPNKEMSLEENSPKDVENPAVSEVGKQDKGSDVAESALVEHPSYQKRRINEKPEKNNPSDVTKGENMQNPATSEVENHSEGSENVSVEHLSNEENRVEERRPKDITEREGSEKIIEKAEKESKVVYTENLVKSVSSETLGQITHVKADKELKGKSISNEVVGQIAPAKMEKEPMGDDVEIPVKSVSSETVGQITPVKPDKELKVGDIQPPVKAVSNEVFGQIAPAKIEKEPKVDDIQTPVESVSSETVGQITPVKADKELTIGDIQPPVKAVSSEVVEQVAPAKIEKESKGDDSETPVESVSSETVGQITPVKADKELKIGDIQPPLKAVSNEVVGQIAPAKIEKEPKGDDIETPVKSVEQVTPMKGKRGRPKKQPRQKSKTPAKRGSRKSADQVEVEIESSKEFLEENVIEKSDEEAGDKEETADTKSKKQTPVKYPERKSLRSCRFGSSDVAEKKEKNPPAAVKKETKKAAVIEKENTVAESKKQAGKTPTKKGKKVKKSDESEKAQNASVSSAGEEDAVEVDPLAIDEATNEKESKKRKSKKVAGKKSAVGNEEKPTSVRSKSVTPKKTEDGDETKRYQNAVSAREMKLLGVSANAVVDENSERSVRTSRRIAQIKIKEQQENRRDLAPFKKTGKKPPPSDKSEDDKPTKKKKKKKNKSKKKDDKDADYKNDEEPKEEKKKHKKLKFNDQNPWLHSSDSSTIDDDLEDYEDEEPQEEENIFKSDHEFSPESDMDDDPEYRPIQKARTARASADTQDDKYDDTVCESCKSKNRPDWILLCDGCDKGWHTDCLTPVLHLVPEGQWFCPPCSHEALLTQLKLTLREFDRLEKQRENEELRKKRLAFVGISLDNVLPSKKKKESVEKSGSESDSGSSSSGSTTSDSEPVYQLRERRTNVTSYRYNEYDEMIRSAIQEDLPPQPPKPAAREIEDDEETEEDDEMVGKEKVPEKPPVNGEEEKTKKAEDDQKDEDEVKGSSDKDDDYAGETEEDDLVDELPPVVPRNRRDAKQKKKRKKLTMDFSSDEEDDDRNDSDFKGSTEESESEDASASGSSEGWGRKNRGPVRRSTRARRRRYDKDFINDDTSDDEDASSKKRKRRDLCSDESSDSDRSWGGSGKRKRSRRARVPTPPRWAKKKKKHKKHKRSDGSDGEKPKKRRVKYGGLDDSDEDKVMTRRTRGRKMNYVEVNDEDSEEEELNKSKKKKAGSGDSDAEFVAEPAKDVEEEEDEDEYVEEDDSEESDEDGTEKPKKSKPPPPPTKAKSKRTKKKRSRKNVIKDSESEEDVDQYLEDLDDEAEEKLMGMLEKGDLPVDELKAAVKRAKEETKCKTGEKSGDEKKDVAEEKAEEKPKRKNVKITPTRAELEAVKEKERAIKEKEKQVEEISDEETEESDDDSDEKNEAGGLLLRSLQGGQGCGKVMPSVGPPVPANELPATIPSAVSSSAPSILPNDQLKPGLPNMPVQQPRLVGPQGARGQFQPIHHGGLPPHTLQMQGPRQPLQSMPMGGQYPRPGLQGYQGQHPVGVPVRSNAPPGQYPQGPPGSLSQGFRPQGPHPQVPMGQGPHGPSPMPIPAGLHSGTGPRLQGPMLMRPQGMQGPPRQSGPHGMHLQGPPGHYMQAQPLQGVPHVPSGQQPANQQAQQMQSPVGPGIPQGAQMLGPKLPPQGHIPPPSGPGMPLPHIPPNPAGAQAPFPPQNIHSPLSDPPEPVKQRKKPGPKPGSKNKKKTEEELLTQAAAKGRPRGKKGDDVTIATVQAPTQFPDAVTAEGGSVITRMLNSPQGTRPIQEPANPRFPGPPMYHAAHPMDPSPSGGAAVSVAKPPFGQENFSQFQIFQRQHYPNFPAEQQQNFQTPPFSESSNFTPPPQHAQQPPQSQAQVAQPSPVVGKAFEEEGGGEFGGLASYFASQAEDDLDT